MSYYGVGYRGGRRGAVGFQAPSPGGPNGPRTPGTLAPSPSPSRPRKPFTVKVKFPRKKVRLPSPFRKWMHLDRKLRIIYNEVKRQWPELLPFTPPAQPYWDVEPGWLYHYDCPVYEPPYPDGTGYKSYSISQSNPLIPEIYKCLSGQVPAGLKPGHQRIIVGPLTPAGTRMAYDEIWQYPFTQPPTRLPEWVPPRPATFVPLPVPYPQVMPDDAPIQQPAPFPIPTFYPMVPSVPDSPWPQGRRTLQPSRDQPGRYVPPYGDPQAGPAVGSDGGDFTPAPPHVNMPPRRGEKEKKGKATPLGAALIMGGGMITESTEAIDAVYQALGKKCKGAKTPQAKLQCIAKNWDTLDAGQAIANLIQNEIEDRLIGKFGRALKSQAHIRSPENPHIGWQTGPAL